MDGKAKILLIEDDTNVNELFQNFLPRLGYEVHAAYNGADGLKMYSEHDFALVIMDFRLPDMTGADIFDRILAQGEPSPCLLMTAYPEVQTAVELMRKGLADYVTKPFTVQEIENRIKKVIELGRLREEVSYYRQATRATVRRESIVGKSDPIQRVKDQIKQIAQYPDTTVLILGETGVGKELVARSIHDQTYSDDRPLVEVDCASTPPDLFESELFGHEKGAFTGAIQPKKGLMEISVGGTVFLDEIGEMDLKLQAKLLRVLETKRFKRVGGTKTLEFSGRIVAATNRELRDEVREGKFREDLFYRLCVFEINIPPLRERREDVPMIAEALMQRFAQRYHKTFQGVSPGTQQFLATYHFPGNVRELRNLIERGVIISQGPLLDLDLNVLANPAAAHAQTYVAASIAQTLSGAVPHGSPSSNMIAASANPSIGGGSTLDSQLPKHLPTMIVPTNPAADPPPHTTPVPLATLSGVAGNGSGSLSVGGPVSGDNLNLDDLEKNAILKAMSQAGNNKTKAAKLLGLTRTSLLRRLEKYNLADL